MDWFRHSKPGPTILFQHVAKCGGTSLVEHFGSLDKRGLCLGFACETKQQVLAEAKRMLNEPGVRPDRIRAVFGHRVFYGLHELFTQPCHYVTLLREPGERVISLYNHHAGIASNPDHPLHDRDRAAFYRNGKLISFETWLNEQYSGNHMIRFLFYAMQGDEVDPPGPMTQSHCDVAKRFIDECWFVGTTETSANDFRVICEAIGLAPPRRRANISQRFLELDSDDSRRQQILERDHYDVQLYDYAVERRAQLLAQR